MRSLVRSYLDFAKGRKKISPWIFLFPLDIISRCMVAFRNFSYDHGILPSLEPELPVISVGNITFGGTNKTPFVEMLTRELLEKGLNTGIISRGYGGRTEKPVVIRNGEASRDVVGDEPLLLSTRLPEVPVAVSRDRLADVTALVSENVDVVIADDAFQHRKLGRDVDIVLVDATCPFGNDLFAPAGILRESPRSLSRADMVIVTKSNQVTEMQLEEVRSGLEKWVSPEKIFISRLELANWALWDGEWHDIDPESIAAWDMVAFSAIGSPSSFWDFLVEQGFPPVESHFFKDHHRFTNGDMNELAERVEATGSDILVCTEKDVHNIPEMSRDGLRLLVPRIKTELDNMQGFLAELARIFRPEVVVTSNGFGEDSIGSLLAKKLSVKFRSADITAFPIVGSGEHYRENNIRVVSNPYVSPSGGVIKYSLSDLWKDLRAGLIRNIFSQQKIWKGLRGNIRTVICVGDVYLLLHALWGQGKSPVLVATAKTVYLTGYWKLEHFIIRNRCRKVWTRDRDTAKEICASGGNAVFSGNPIMDLICDNNHGEDPWDISGDVTRVLLLPGSRNRAYKDISLLLQTAGILDKTGRNEFVAVIAPTLKLDRILASSSGWSGISGEPYLLERDGTRIKLYQGSLVSAASRAHILIGLGGTANQVCAGLGIPVVSVHEKGKVVQKKLLGDSEVLVRRDPNELARKVREILDSPEVYEKMSNAGKTRLGSPGALDDVIDSLLEESGWDIREKVFLRLAEEVEDVTVFEKPAMGT